MNKNTIIIIIVVLVLVVGVFAYLNRDLIADKKEINESAEVLIRGQDVEKQFTLDEVRKLGEKEFTADLKSSGNPSEEHTYTGVPVKNLFEQAGIDIKEQEQVTIRSVDGYTIALSSEDILDDDNVYIAYKIDGDSLGTREDGGSGPYQIIIRKDPFSQRWAKFVVEIELND